MALPSSWSLLYHSVLMTGVQAALRMGPKPAKRILIVNPTNSPVHWVTTIDDTSPGSGGSPLPATMAAKVPALGEKSLSLLSGERLWLVCPYLSEGNSFPVTLQT